MNIENEYYQERRQASCRTNEESFADILSQHSLVMVDAAVPNLSKLQCVQLGSRLANVQHNWVDLLCAGGRATEVDKQYRRVVSKVIVRFTNKLMEMITEDKFIPRADLVDGTDTFHSRISGRAESSLQETSRLFHAYVDSLASLYQTRTDYAHKRASLQCMNVAYALGQWLDATTFENAK